MTAIRVLIVAGGVLARRFLAALVEADGALQVAATAATGRIALARIPQVNPDVVLIDQDLPEADRLATLALLHKSYPQLSVIFLGRTPEARRGSPTRAATECLTLPNEYAGLEEARPWLIQHLLPRLKHLGSSAKGGLAPRVAPATLVDVRLALPRVEVVVIGTSTGGPNALATLLTSMPVRFPVPLLIVQHMPPGFTRQLAERLGQLSGFPVSEAIAGAKVEPGQVWIAPGDYHLGLTRQGLDVRVGLHQGPPENSCRPSVDVLFRAAAEVFGAGVLGVVLTGMGQDGMRGCECIREARGQVLAQDEASSVVWGMPGHVVRAGLAQQVLPLEHLAAEIVRRVRRGRSASALDVRDSSEPS